MPNLSKPVRWSHFRCSGFRNTRQKIRLAPILFINQASWMFISNASGIVIAWFLILWETEYIWSFVWKTWLDDRGKCDVAFAYEIRGFRWKPQILKSIVFIETQKQRLLSEEGNLLYSLFFLSVVTGWPRHRENGEFGYHFSRQGKHREFRYGTGKIWITQGIFLISLKWSIL